MDDLTWRRCLPWLEAALAYGPRTHEAEDIRAAVEGGAMQFWPGSRSVVITEVVQFPRCRAVRGIFAGGNLPEIRDEIVPRIEAWGREIGCDYAWTGGRAGWARALAGYEFFAVQLSKRLT